MALRARLVTGVSFLLMWSFEVACAEEGDSGELWASILVHDSSGDAWLRLTVDEDSPTPPPPAPTLLLSSFPLLLFLQLSSFSLSFLLFSSDFLAWLGQ